MTLFLNDTFKKDPWIPFLVSTFKRLSALKFGL